MCDIELVNEMKIMDFIAWLQDTGERITEEQLAKLSTTMDRLEKKRKERGENGAVSA